MKNTILITGGAGFIGSHVVKLLAKKYPHKRIINLDKLTYAGNLNNLTEIEKSSNYTFIKGDICDRTLVDKLFDKYEIDSVIHLAAESHVDRSITNPTEFINTNIVGTVTLLETAKKHWLNPTGKLFYHISTDEVYGSLSSNNEYFTETTCYAPRSPYSASKASSDHLVRAYFSTYKLPIIISNCSNNYGPNQFPEKLIPLVINNIKTNKPIPVYGKGQNIRDWLYVEDHAKAIDTIFHKATIGETYNIGGVNEWKNIDLIKLLCNIVDKKLGKTPGNSQKLITYVADRAGHDMRYAIDITKIKKELHWAPTIDFNKGLELTVEWYLQNEKWLNNVVSGEYLKYYEKQYQNKFQ